MQLIVFCIASCDRNFINGHARRLLQIGDGYKYAAFLQAHRHAHHIHTKHKQPRRRSQTPTPVPAPSPSPLSAPPKASPSPSASAPAIFPSGFHPLAAPPRPLSPLPPTPPAHSPHKHFWRNYSFVTAGSAVFLVMAAASVIYYRAKKVGTVRPWATGLSGQLQRAFVTGKIPSVLCAFVMLVYFSSSVFRLAPCTIMFQVYLH